MARILCVNDFVAYSEMVAQLLRRKGGHDARTAIVPFSEDVITDFSPDLIIINLVRKIEALGAPLKDFYAEVDGARAFRAIAQHPAAAQCPILLTSIAVLEFEVPRDLPYVAFVEVPQKVDHMLQVIDHIMGIRLKDIVQE